MPEPTQVLFSHKELVTVLIKSQGLHEGIWGLYVKFGLKAVNSGASDADLQPTAMIPVLGIGLQRFEEVNGLSVNAAEVNPKSATATKKTARKKR